MSRGGTSSTKSRERRLAATSRWSFRADKLDEYKREDWYRELASAHVEMAVVQRLHAKIYINDTHVMFGSANLTHDSWMNSHEVAMVVRRCWSVGRSVQGYVDDLFRTAVPLTRRRVHEAPAAQRQGFCIRCGTHIQLDPHRPFCRTDHSTWKNEGAPQARENHCHQCGTRWATTRVRPRCLACFRAVTPGGGE